MIVEAVEFIRTGVGGLVHVLEGYDHHPHHGRAFQQVARCGRRARPLIFANVTTFEDTDLCPRCWQLTPPEHRPTLFAHPQRKEPT